MFCGRGFRRIFWLTEMPGRIRTEFKPCFAYLKKDWQIEILKREKEEVEKYLKELEERIKELQEKNKT